MLSPAPGVRVFFAVEPVDMRKSFDGLAGRVRELQLDPANGHLYVFVNRRRTLMKAVYFDRNGWVVVAKRLERGSYQLPQVRDGQTTARIEPVELACILEGIDVSRAPRRLRYRRPPPRR